MSKAKILSAAEELFSTRGFGGTSLRELGERVGIRPASLYFHFPKGKEEIYLEVFSGRANSYRAAIQSIARRSVTLESTLKEFGYWFIEQPPMNMALIVEIDMPYLTAFGKKRVKQEVARCIFSPLRELFSENPMPLRKGFDPNVFVGAFNVLLAAVPTGARMGNLPPRRLVDLHVELFLHGAFRSGSSA